MIKNYLWPDDPWWHAEPHLLERIYDEKSHVARLLQPKSVLEIGVRAGYTAAMFLAAGTKKYVGLDATDSWGGTEGAVDFAKIMLPREFPKAKIEIHHVNTQAVDTLEQYGPVELVHVDGDHTLEGCTHDLALALTLKPKWILVDDMVHHPESCYIAAHRFVDYGDFNHVTLNTLRGDMLIRIR